MSNEIAYGIFIQNVDSTKQFKRVKQGLPAWPEFVYDENTIVAKGVNLRGDCLPLDVYATRHKAEMRKAALEEMDRNQQCVTRYFIRCVKASDHKIHVSRRRTTKNGIIEEY
ncbi:hypothetical protein AB6F95_004638 [Salmonella enterica]